ncbi:MAG: hypothetical protein GY722_22860 [bacterium]|nr:hypothetical protein [bacterium]
MLPALNDAAEHDRLIRSERELLEGTVQGSVSLLSAILVMLDPAAAERGMRLKRHVGGLAEAMVIDRPLVSIGHGYRIGGDPVRDR